MSIEYAKAKCQDAMTAAAAGYGSANATIDDYVMVTEELVANLTKEQNKKMDATAKQLEALMASTTAMTQLSKALKPLPRQRQLPTLPPRPPPLPPPMPIAKQSKRRIDSAC